MSINKVTISGNLTRDAETRMTQSGTTVITFGVAVNDRRRNQSTGEWEDKPNFVDCVMFDREGNRQWMVNALRKGFKVFIEGSLSYSSWPDRDTGKNRSKLEVTVRNIDANWPKKEGGYQQQAPTAPPAPQYPQAAPAPAYAPQQPQAYQQPQQPGYAPQAGYQQPVAPAQTAPQAPQQMQQAPAQQQMPVAPAPAPTMDMYDEDIPF